MKAILKKIVVNSLAIILVSFAVGGIHWGNNLKTLLLAAVALAFLNAFIRPVLKILFLPVNVITLGLFGWVINVLIIYVVTLIVPGFSVTPFTLSLFGLTLILNQFFSYLVISIFLSLATTASSWLIT